MNTSREKFLVNMTRSQIVNAIRDDLPGGGSESMMKEVFEHCEDAIELEIVYTEMRAIVSRVKAGRVIK